MNINYDIKKRIILLSDLWGNDNANWVTYYTKILEEHFDLQFYDSCDLAEINHLDEKESKHHQFVNGGIEKAVGNLVQKETDFVNVLAFSIGGTIAWKTALSGLKIQNLFAISSTRLRYETQKLDGNIELFYGKNDSYKPDHNWFQLMNLAENIYANEEHEFYRKKEIAEGIGEKIIKTIEPS